LGLRLLLLYRAYYGERRISLQYDAITPFLNSHTNISFNWRFYVFLILLFAAVAQISVNRSFGSAADLSNVYA